MPRRIKYERRNISLDADLDSVLVEVSRERFQTVSALIRSLAYKDDEIAERMRKLKQTA